jgi:hypothetical protein
MIEKLFEKLGNDNRAYNILPTPIGFEDASRMMRSLFSNLIHEKKFWRVLFVVGDMNCNGRIFIIGKITFYDPRVYDFGESYQFDLDYNSLLDMGEPLKGEVLFMKPRVHPKTNK